MDPNIEKIYSAYLRSSAVSTDTRAIKAGSVFFALKGEKFNANQLAAEALDKGCAYAVIDEEKYRKDERYFLVPNVLECLQQLANFHRKQLKVPLVGITGSNGKTTSKELLAAVLGKKYATWATRGNLNNHIGVPLTLLSMNAGHEMAIIEMGANHIGEIALLCRIAEPDYGIITNIGKAHLEGFGSPEGVIKAKSELYDFIKTRKGTLFVNGDNPLLMSLSEGINRITYGTLETYDCTGTLTEIHPHVALQWKAKTGTASAVRSHLIGKYNFENILSAICVANYFNVSPAAIAEAIAGYVPSNNRSQVIQKNSNTILLDAYNANPTSMHAALENFFEIKAPNKMLIIGDMLELGHQSASEHQQVIDFIASKKFSNTVLVGKHFSESNNKINARCFLKADEVMAWLRDQRIENTTILIKGSRGIQLEKIAEVL